MPQSSGIRRQISGRFHKRAYSIAAKRSGEGLGIGAGRSQVDKSAPGRTYVKLPNTHVKFQVEAIRLEPAALVKFAPLRA